MRLLSSLYNVNKPLTYFGHKLDSVDTKLMEAFVRSVLSDNPRIYRPVEDNM